MKIRLAIYRKRKEIIAFLFGAALAIQFLPIMQDVFGRTLRPCPPSCGETHATQVQDYHGIWHRTTS